MHSNYKLIEPLVLFIKILVLLSAATNVCFSHLDSTEAKWPYSHLDDDDNNNNVIYMLHELYVNLFNPDNIPMKYYSNSTDEDI